MNGWIHSLLLLVNRLIGLNDKLSWLRIIQLITQHILHSLLILLQIRHLILRNGKRDERRLFHGEKGRLGRLLQVGARRHEVQKLPHAILHPGLAPVHVDDRIDGVHRVTTHPLVLVLLLGRRRWNEQTRRHEIDARVDTFCVCLCDELRDGNARGRIHVTTIHHDEQTQTGSSPTRKM